MVMSAVSSVRTPRRVGDGDAALERGRRRRYCRRRCRNWRSASASRRLGSAPPESMRSVTVGTSTSAVVTASASAAWLIGLSSRLSRVSNSSRMRVSTLSGSLRVTTTSGFLTRSPCISPRSRRAEADAFSGPFRRSLTARSPTLRRLRNGAVDPDATRCLPDGPAEDKVRLRSHGARLRRRGRDKSDGGAHAAGSISHRADRPEPCDAARAPAELPRRRRLRPDRAKAASGLPVPRFVSLKSDRVNVRGGPTKDQRCELGLYPRRPAGRDHRRIRELAAHPRLGRRRGLGLPLAAVGPAYRGCVQRRRRRTPWCRSTRSRIRTGRSWRSCRPALLGAVKSCTGGWCRVTARASTAGSSRTACGASIPTRRSSDAGGRRQPSGDDVMAVDCEERVARRGNLRAVCG